MNRNWIKKLLKGCGGFSLLEVMIALVIMATMTAMLAPLTFQFLEDAREKSTRQEMELIHQTIFGKQSAGQYGYVGDMGGLPDTLADLNTKPGGADNYVSDGRVNGVGIGWNGPYFNLGYSTTDYLQDAWGRDYTYDSGTGQISSLGSDGAPGTNDDLVIPPYSTDTRGDLSITVTAYDSTPGGLVTVDDDCVEVDVYYALIGTESFLDDIPWDGTDGVFEATNLHQGIHAVEVTGIDSCDTTPDTVNANAVIFQGTTALTIFLGTFDIP